MNNSIYVIVPDPGSDEPTTLYNSFASLLRDLRSHAVQEARLYFEIEGLIVPNKFRAEFSDEPMPKFIAEDFVKDYCAQRIAPYEYGKVIFDNAGKACPQLGYDYERHPYWDIPEIKKTLYDAAFYKIKELIAKDEWKREEDL